MPDAPLTGRPLIVPCAGDVLMLHVSVRPVPSLVFSSVLIDAAVAFSHKESVCEAPPTKVTGWV